MLNIELKIEEVINNLNNDDLKKIFIDLLIKINSPTFGAMTKKELENILFDAMRNIGFINKEPQIYEVIKNLRVSQSKARNLIYESSLRRLNENELDELLLQIFRTPSFYKENDFVAVEIDNPILIDRLKFIIKKFGGSATDGSFSNTIVKLKEDGFAALVEYFADKNNINIRQELIKSGLLDSNNKKMGKLLFKIIDSVKDKSFSDTFDNIINFKDIIKDNIKNIKLNNTLKESK